MQLKPTSSAFSGTAKKLFDFHYEVKIKPLKKKERNNFLNSLKERGENTTLFSASLFTGSRAPNTPEHSTYEWVESDSPFLITAFICTSAKQTNKLKSLKLGLHRENLGVHRTEFTALLLSALFLFSSIWLLNLPWCPHLTQQLHQGEGKQDRLSLLSGSTSLHSVLWRFSEALYSM